VVYGPRNLGSCRLNIRACEKQAQGHCDSLRSFVCVTQYLFLLFG
jgi:hypothetical protein